VTPSDDLSPPRRPIFFPVVIATVFLTIIGMTAGFVLGERHQDRLQAGDSGTTETQVTVPASTEEPNTGEANTGEPNTAKPGRSCPQESIETAGELGLRTDLRQVTRIVTDNGTTVWICQDGAGALYYQSKTGGVDADLVQKENGLFLSRVEQRGDGDYRATASNGTEFLVSREQLEVRFADGRPSQVNEVVEAD
jgi:hypothetical protein